VAGRRCWQRISLGSHARCFRNRELLSCKVENDEDDLSKLIDDALFLAEEVVWVVDQPGGGAALLLALLWERNQRVLYISASLWTGPATSTAASRRLMPAMLASLLSRPA
jgi:hypothetical protein